jgi:hypothetical protein
MTALDATGDAALKRANRTIAFVRRIEEVWRKAKARARFARSRGVDRGNDLVPHGQRPPTTSAPTGARASS